MNPRWRRFLLVLTLIACALVHAPRLNQMQAKPVPAAQPRPASIVVPAQSKVLTTEHLDLKPWAFQPSPLPPLDAQDLSLYLARERTVAPTASDIEANADDLAFFIETEFATDVFVAAPTFRTVGRLSLPVSTNDFAIQPRRVRRNSRGVNYIKPALNNAFPLDSSSYAVNLPIRATNRPIVSHPQTSDGDESSGVGETPTPTPTPVGTPDPIPNPGDTGGTGGVIDDPGTGEVGGGLGGGLGGLPPPGSEIPEPAFLAPLLCIAMLLKRPGPRH